MRTPAALVIVAALHACATAPTTEPVTKPAQPSVAPPVTPAPAAAPVITPDPQPIEPAAPMSEAARLLAEVEAMDPSARRAWAIAAMPQIIKHDTIDPALAAWAGLRRRAAGRTTLWVRTRDDRCFVVRGEWTEEGFSGRAHAAVKMMRGVKRVEYESIEIDRLGITVTGPNGEDFARDESGRWQLVGGFGVGGLHSLADRPLSKFRGGAAYYAGEVYALTVECAQRASHEQRCTDGTTRKYERCGGLTVNVRSPVHHGVRITIGAGTDAPLQDCSQQCPVDPDMDRLPALARVVGEQKFFRSTAPVAAVYTTREACQADGTFTRKRADPA